MTACADAAFPGRNGRIAFEQPSSVPGGCGPAVSSINPDGADLFPLDQGGVNDDGYDPVWSPDGRRLALAAQPSTNCSFSSLDIAVEDGVTGDSRYQLTSNGVFDRWPAWSPDGERIVFRSDRDFLPGEPCGPVSDLYVIPDVGGPATRITADSHREEMPDWSPRGDWIVYAKTIGGYDPEGCDFVSFGGGTYLIRPDGSQDHQIDTFGEDYDWSPDGSKIVYRDGPGHLWVANFSPPIVSSNFELTMGPGVDDGPTWSPDGTQIAFTRNGALWLMNADGTNQHPVLSEGAPIVASNPDWQPISTYVRPKAATPILAALVPAYATCKSPNRVHGGSLTFGSCSPPDHLSPTLTVGVGDGSPAFSRSVGSVRINALPGIPGGADDADMRVRLSITNVMRKSDLSDYTGELGVDLSLQMTDKEGAVGQTAMGFGLSATAPCTATASTIDGATCAVDTTVEALIPNAIVEGARAIFELGPIKVRDGGPDEDADTTADDGLLATQGVFVP
jgi:Tol biopolymer transport system component